MGFEILEGWIERVLPLYGMLINNMLINNILSHLATTLDSCYESIWPLFFLANVSIVTFLPETSFHHLRLRLLLFSLHSCHFFDDQMMKSATWLEATQLRRCRCRPMRVPSPDFSDRAVPAPTSPLHQQINTQRWCLPACR